MMLDPLHEPLAAQRGPAFERWSAPLALALALTYAWLWLLAFSIAFAPPWQAEPLQIRTAAARAGSASAGTAAGRAAQATQPAAPPVDATRIAAEFVVDDRGAVRDIKIVQSTGAAFDWAVIEALGKTSFIACSIGERPVATRLRRTFNFELK